MSTFAHLLGYAPDGMAALAVLGSAIEDASLRPAGTEVAALTWSARLLSSELIAHVMGWPAR